MKKNKVFSSLILPLISVFALFVSCGLDTYVYLEPVEIVNSTINWANIVLPNQSAHPEFRNYIIFYRIYLSDFYEPSFTSDLQRNNVNTYLAQDYTFLDSYTTNDTVTPSVIDGNFRNRKYFSLYLSLDQINERSIFTVLNVAGGGTIQLDFTKTPPILTDTGSVDYFLFRDRIFTPQPNTRLYNYTNEWVNGTFTNEINTDMQTNTGPSSTQYAYVSMYIIATGIDDNYSALYSRPTHLGIFYLPTQ